MRRSKVARLVNSMHLGAHNYRVGDAGPVAAAHERYAGEAVRGGPRARRARGGSPAPDRVRRPLLPSEHAPRASGPDPHGRGRAPGRAGSPAAGRARTHPLRPGDRRARVPGIKETAARDRLYQPLFPRSRDHRRKRLPGSFHRRRNRDADRDPSGSARGSQRQIDADRRPRANLDHAREIDRPAAFDPGPGRGECSGRPRSAHAPVPRCRAWPRGEFACRRSRREGAERAEPSRSD